MPPVPTFDFEKKPLEPVRDLETKEQEEALSEKSVDSNQEVGKGKETTSPEVTGKKKIPKKKARPAVVVPENLPIAFSTEVRISIQTDLAIISRERKDARRKDYAIKQLLHEALCLWMESPEMSDAVRDRKIKLMQFPKNDHYLSFNNRINYDLDVKFRKIKRDREDVRHPVKTIIDDLNLNATNSLVQNGEYAIDNKRRKRPERIQANSINLMWNKHLG